MDGRKQVGIPSSSSSSFTTDLFGSKEPSSAMSSSSGIFDSIFAPSSKVKGREFSRSDMMVDKKLDFSNDAWNAKPDHLSQRKEGESQSAAHKGIDSLFTEERVPCHFSSSIYYGGQDIYSSPQTTQSAGLHSSANLKDGGDEDIESASRGNWWQANRAIRNVTALGDGHGNIGLHSKTPSSVGEHDSAEASRGLSDPLHPSTAAVRNRGQSGLVLPSLKGLVSRPLSSSGVSGHIPLPPSTPAVLIRAISPDAENLRFGFLLN
ncbi:hypothetical protein Ancab_032132 [Ancistrocladus abbreviatus]